MTCNLHVHIYKHNLATQLFLYILLHKLLLLNVAWSTDRCSRNIKKHGNVLTVTVFCCH